MIGQKEFRVPVDGKEFRARIWGALRKEGMSQRDLARALDMPPATINRYLRREEIGGLDTVLWLLSWLEEAEGTEQ